VLSGREEIEWRDQAAVPEAQAHERLDTGDPARTGVGLGLEVELEAVLLKVSPMRRQAANKVSAASEKARASSRCTWS
jgi:hypothetical protein